MRETVRDQNAARGLAAGVRSKHRVIHIQSTAALLYSTNTGDNQRHGECLTARLGIPLVVRSTVVCIVVSRVTQRDTTVGPCLCDMPARHDRQCACNNIRCQVSCQPSVNGYFSADNALVYSSLPRNATDFLNLISKHSNQYDVDINNIYKHVWILLMNLSKALYLRGKLVIYNMLNMRTIFTNIQWS